MAQLSTSSSQAGGSFRNWLYIFRVVILALCSILNASNLVLIVQRSLGDGPVQGFENIGIISAVITLVVIPAVLIISRIRKNAWFVYIVTEVVIFGLLCILWIVTAALVVQDSNLNFETICTSKFRLPTKDCKQPPAIMGLAVTIFVLLFIYVLTLVIYAVVRASKAGSGVWFQTVQEQTSGTSGGSGGAVSASAGAAPYSPLSMWDERPTTNVHSNITETISITNLPTYPVQAPPAPGANVITYAPSPLSQAVATQMGAAHSPGDVNLVNAAGSSTTNLPAGAAASVSAGVGTAEQYYASAPQQVNMQVTQPPQQQVVGLQNVMGSQGAPVTPSYPQV